MAEGLGTRSPLGLRVVAGWLALAVCAATLAISCSPASALISHGHVFAGVLEGTGEHALVNPNGVAVDELSGEVYVADHTPGHEQVERFKPNGAGGYEFLSAFRVKAPEDIAIDNSTSESDPSRGDVYVTGAEEEGAGPEEHDTLYKFSPATGKVLFKKALFHGKKEEELFPEDIHGLAVDAGGKLWMYYGEEGLISAFSDAEANRWEPSLDKDLEIPLRYECPAARGFAIAPNDEYLYVSHVRETPLEECPEEESPALQVAVFSAAGQPVARALEHESATGVALDPADSDLYVDNATSVAAFSQERQFIQRFGSGDLSAGGALAVDSSRDDVLAAEPSAGKVVVFGPEGAGPPTVDSLYAQNLTSSSERLIAQIDPKGLDTTYYFQYGPASCAANPAQCTDVPLPPGTDIGAGFGDRSAMVELTGLQPNSTYFYRVLAHNEDGTVESPESSETFFTTLPSAVGVLADHREWEQASPPEKHGAAVEPISREGALIQASVDGDAISWTASSPITGEPQGDRRPEPVQVISTRSGEGWSSKDIATPHTKGEGYEPGEATEYRLFSPDLSLAIVQPQVPKEPLENPPLAPGVSEKTIYRRAQASGEFEALVSPADDSAGSKFGGKLEFAGATPDLHHVLFSSEVPLIAGAGERGLYDWEAGSALKLLSVLPGPEHTPAGEPNLGDHGRDVRNAISVNGSKVFWTNGLGQEEDEGPLYMRDTSKEETIQINAAQGVREPSEEERGEGLDEVHFQAASSDGSHVFFTDTWPLTKQSSLEPLRTQEEVEEAPGKSHNVGRAVDLYEYDTETGKLSDLTATSRGGEQADVLGTLPGASEDGSYVYFVANGVLAPGAKPGNCQRTNPFDFPHPSEECNLYVSETDPEEPAQRQIKLIARLSAEDAADWAGGASPLPQDLGGLTSAVSANGRYLAFMSEKELTGYDNVDSNPEAKGAHDEEVFIYDASAGRLTCASCNPSGAPPHGVYDTEEAGEGLGLTVDRPETWAGHWLAGSLPGWTLFELNNPRAQHQSRYLSNEGRLFFDSADALVPAVTAPTRQEEVNGKTLSVGVENVYEYEPSGLGSCTQGPGCVALVSSGTSEHESAFLDASESGEDAFFITAAKLVAQDTDNSLDVYDARVCGTPSSEACLPDKPPPPPVCVGEECRPASSPQPGFSAPASSTFSGPGNVARTEVRVGEKPKTIEKPKLTPAQKLAAALKACRKLKNRHKRAACEAQAKRAYRTAVKNEATKTLKRGAARAQRRRS